MAAGAARIAPEPEIKTKGPAAQAGPLLSR